jgi:hypothetical protein
MQVNHSITVSRGTIRGLHYQRPPHMAVRLVSCIRGEIFDVAVDVRPESSTYLHWYGERLSPDNGRAFLIPEGFAHGFQPLTDDCEIVYCHSKLYGSKGRRVYRSASASRMERVLPFSRRSRWAHFLFKPVRLACMNGSNTVHPGSSFSRTTSRESPTRFASPQRTICLSIMPPRATGSWQRGGLVIIRSETTRSRCTVARMIATYPIEPRGPPATRQSSPAP